MKILGRSTVPLLLAAAAVPAWTGLSAQEQVQPAGVTVQLCCHIDRCSRPVGQRMREIDLGGRDHGSSNAVTGGEHDDVVRCQPHERRS